MNNQKNVLFISGRETNYPRNALFINSLQNYFHVDIIGPKQKEISRGNYARIILNSIKGILYTIPKIIFRKYAYILIGFFGQFLVFPISLMTKIPISLDFFVPAYDTLVNDRKKIKKNTFLAKLLFKLDYLSCCSADNIFVDTKTNLDYYTKLMGIRPQKMKVIYVGCNDELFFPKNTHIDNDLVLYYCSYLPLHGVDIVIKAAKILDQRTSIHFKIIGEGMEYQKIRNLAYSLNLTNVNFMPPMPLEVLPDEIAKAAICLGGHFGNTQKAKRVIAGKTYQLLAMAKPTIVGDNKANHELLTHGKDAFFCKMNDHIALANSICYLHEHRIFRENLGIGGYKTFIKKASNKVLEKQIYKTLFSVF